MRVSRPMLSPLSLGTFGSEPDLPPAVKVSPQSTLQSIGFWHTFHAEFEGSNLTYQWYMNDVPIVGATDTDYMFLMDKTEHNAEYHCVATNDLGSATTDKALLSLRNRIYMNYNWIPEQPTTDTIRVIFKADGDLLIVTSQGSFQETWVSEELPLSMTEYTATLESLSSGLSVSPNSDFQLGVPLLLSSTANPTIELDVNATSSQNFRISAQDLVMPDYNWAGWDNDVLYTRKL